LLQNADLNRRRFACDSAFVEGAFHSDIIMTSSGRRVLWKAWKINSDIGYLENPSQSLFVKAGDAASQCLSLFMNSV
jgi:hypothetical protein